MLQLQDVSHFIFLSRVCLCVSENARLISPEPEQRLVVLDCWHANGLAAVFFLISEENAEGVDPGFPSPDTPLHFDVCMES